MTKLDEKDTPGSRHTWNLPQGPKSNFQDEFPNNICRTPETHQYYYWTSPLKTIVASKQNDKSEQGSEGNVIHYRGCRSSDANWEAHQAGKWRHQTKGTLLTKASWDSKKIENTLGSVPGYDDWTRILVGCPMDHVTSLNSERNFITQTLPIQCAQYLANPTDPHFEESDVYIRLTLRVIDADWKE